MPPRPKVVEYPQAARFAGGVGVPTSSKGSATQQTSKSTTVVLSAILGFITMDAASLAAAAIVSFTLTNDKIAAGDLVQVTHASAGTLGAYTVTASAGAGSATIAVRNNSAGPLAEAIVLGFNVIKAS